MKFIQTLYFDKSKDPFQFNFGWVAPEYHLMSWALSCLQLKKLYKNVDMYCNSEAVTLLKNELGLPYDNYYTNHDDLKIPNENLWALPKLFTYSLQNEPFLHVDGDVFMFSKLPDALLSSGLICQNEEEATSYYLETQKELVQNFSYFPDCVKKDFNSKIPIRAVNAGILGGSNIDFFKEYSEAAFQYINKNTANLSFINADRFNVFFEQHLFYSLAKEKQLPIEVLIKELINDNQYLYLDNFHEVPCKRTYLHLLGNYKKDEHTCRTMTSKLRELYPDYYYKIIALFKKKKIPIFSDLYQDKTFSSSEGYLNYANKSRQHFLEGSSNDKEANISTQKIEIKSLSVLQNIINGVTDFSKFSKNELVHDFMQFSTNLLESLTQISTLKVPYIYGRDLDSALWFCKVFGNDADIPNKIIVKCNGISVIKSAFDWAGLLQQSQRVGVKYYELLQINSGESYNLIIPEVYDEGFSLFDMDEMEKIILDHLASPVSIKNLHVLMLAYVEEEIIIHHLKEYEDLIIVMLKQLILKKAIMPVQINNSYIE